MASIELKGVFAGLAAAGLTLLCQCSLLFDLSGLDDGGAGASDLDAAHDGGSDATVSDAADDEGSAEGVDAAGDGGSDVVASDVADDEGSAGGPDAAAEAGSEAGRSDAAGDSGSLDATDGGGDGGGSLDAADGSGGEAGMMDAPGDGGDITAGLVAYYRFDETSGTTSSDATGNGHTALMQGATFASGLVGNAATMNGSSQYVSLPSGIVSGLPSFSIATWVKLAPAWSRVFDFGTGTNTYMFLTPPRGAGTVFAITTSGPTGEQRINTTVPATAGWQHVCVTLTGATNTLYVNGVQIAQNTATTLNPVSLGATTQNWLGRSQFAADPYVNGQIDNFRIYDRALGGSEVMQLFQQQL